MMIIDYIKMTKMSGAGAITDLQQRTGALRKFAVNTCRLL